MLSLLFVHRRLSAVIAVLLVGAGVTVFGADFATAATCQSWGVPQPQNPGSAQNVLAGVAATSACNAWAVGNYSSSLIDQTLIERWNGAKWNVQKSLDPGGSSTNNVLVGVAAVSSSNAWAVGTYGVFSVRQTLIEHWNGRWRIQPSLNPGGPSHGNELDGVAATSSSNAWAVGYYNNGTVNQTLIERWNGMSWKMQKSQNPGGTSNDNELHAVAAISKTDAWAVGQYSNSSGAHTLIEHWNGTAWKQVASPNGGSSGSANELLGVAATSHTNAWAVGDFRTGAFTSDTLVEHWNGTRWKIQPSPSPGGSGNDNFLAGVAATSTSNAWAVGGYHDGTDQAIIEHWDGKTWNPQPSVDPGNGDLLAGVAAISPTSAWAVGDYVGTSSLNALALHCC